MSLYALVFGSTEIKIESDFNVEQSVQRLSEKITPINPWNPFLWLFSVTQREHAVGIVSANRVSLQRVRPFRGNAFKPFFVGGFTVNRNGATSVVHGTFAMHWLVRTFLVLWFCGSGLGVLFPIYSFLASPTLSPDPLGVAVGALIVFLGGTVVVAYGKSLARDDTTWLLDMMREALTDRKYRDPLLNDK
jgi:hypothetical protein